MKNLEYKKMLIEDILEWQSEKRFTQEGLEKKPIRTLEIIHHNMKIKKIDKGIEDIKKEQAGTDHKTMVEQEAEKLICQCRFEEANALLATLD